MMPLLCKSIFENKPSIGSLVIKEVCACTTITHADLQNHVVPMRCVLN